MTLHYPDTDAAPTPYGATPRNDHVTHVADVPADEAAVPIYARKPVRKNYNKKLLMAVPVVLALGVGAWALTVGESSRSSEAVPADSTDGLTTSRLDVAQPVSPEVDVPVVSEAAPVEATPAPAAASVSPPAARVARAAAPAPAARRAAAPARRAAAPAAAASVPAAPQPYSSPALTTVITEPAPVAAPPPIVAPTPVLPADPAPTETPPGG